MHMYISKIIYSVILCYLASLWYNVSCNWSIHGYIWHNINYSAQTKISQTVLTHTAINFQMSWTFTNVKGFHDIKLCKLQQTVQKLRVQLQKNTISCLKNGKWLIWNYKIQGFFPMFFFNFFFYLGFIYFLFKFCLVIENVHSNVLWVEILHYK